jgi:hypothetical protein
LRAAGRSTDEISLPEHCIGGKPAHKTSEIIRRTARNYRCRRRDLTSDGKSQHAVIDRDVADEIAVGHPKFTVGVGKSAGATDDLNARGDLLPSEFVLAYNCSSRLIG